MIGSSLISGEECVEHMRRIKRAYEASKLKKAQTFTGLKLESYHPLLGHQKVLENLTEKDLINIQKLKFENFSDNNLYAIRSNLDNKFKNSDHFYFDRSGYYMPSKWKPASDSKEVFFALEVLKQKVNWAYKLLSELVDDMWLICNGQQVRFLGGAGTDYYFLGLMFMSLRPKTKFIVYEQVFALAHELGHTVLYYLQAGKNPIAEDSFGEWIYSGIRKTKRPSYASLHAAMALGYMVVVSRALQEDETLSAEEHQFLSRKTDEFSSNLEMGLKAIPNIQLTDLGDMIVKELHSFLDSK